MSYSVEYLPKAKREMDKLDARTRSIIDSWVRKYLVGCENPRFKGKALTGALRGKWRYRVGDYRLVAEIYDDKVLILVVEVAHRSTVYR